MTIVPLRVGGPNATVVDNYAQFSLGGPALLIRPIDTEQLDCNKAPATYDLRVGEQYRDHSKDIVRAVTDTGIYLAPGAAVVVLTREEVHLPEGFFGQIAPKVTLLEQGISNTPSKVDPGFSGRLRITVFNHGRKAATLAPGQKFCALFVSRVEDGVTPYDKAADPMRGAQPQLSLRQRVRQGRDSVWRAGSNAAGWLAVLYALAKAIEFVFKNGLRLP